MSGNYGWNIGDMSREFISQEAANPLPIGVPVMPTPPFSNNNANAPYYWCESGGQVPPGAVKAGVDKDGGTVYVGRAFHAGEILPAKVLLSHNVAYVAWGGEEHAKHDFEVLCNGGCTVIWQETSAGVVPPGAVPVGSTSDGERLFVGRAFHDGTLTPGKIHPSHGTCYIPYNGQELSFSNYEALVLQ